MKILVTGYGGQLGYDVVKAGQLQGIEMIGTTSSELNITDEAQVLTYVQNLQPDIIIHCAAYTAVDQAEDDKAACYAVNVQGTKNLAQAAKNVDAKLIYISTDYVFNGEGEAPFTELDVPQPIGYYGETKHQGEKIIEDLLEKYFIVRISWVFGINGKNFVKTMLSLAEIRVELNVVGDQYGSPTYTADLAKLLLEFSKSDNYGVYHATNEGFCSWADFAKEIFYLANNEVTVHAIPTEQYPTRAKRPKNSRLSKDKLEKNGFTKLPEWQDALSRYLVALQQEEE